MNYRTRQDRQLPWCFERLQTFSQKVRIRQRFC